MATKTEVLRDHLNKYLKASRREKKCVLNHLTAVLGMHRKAIIRALKREQMRDSLKPRKRSGPKVVYTPDVNAALKQTWEAGNEVCGELLYPLVNEYIDILIRDNMWHHSDEATGKLRSMSLSTMRRKIGSFVKIRSKRKGLSATTPSSLKRIIPIFTGPWKGYPPGYGQIDTVVHCGSSLLGDMVYTVNYTDAATLLTIPHAQWNKGMEATKKSMEAIREKMPFPWLGAHPDTGSEFINHFVVDWCKKENISLSRSRPGKKNDNMYVEERNSHVIRRTIGYIRLDCPESVDALNNVYDVLIPYLLYFVAVRRTLKKERIRSKYRRKYEKNPRPPYERILEHSKIDASIKEQLIEGRRNLNPLVLKLEIDKRVHELYEVQKRCGKSKF